MIKKLYTERDLLFAVSNQVILTMEIEGCKSTDNLEIAIDFAVNRYETLRSRILQDTDGEAYFVPLEGRCKPNIEVRDYHLELNELVKEQQKIPFDFTKGQMIRFIIDDLGDKMYLNIIEAHIAGDGKSLLLLAQEIITNLSEIENGVFRFEDKPLIPLEMITKKDVEKKVVVNDLVKYSMEEYNKSWREEEEIIGYDDYVKVYNQYWSNHETEVATLKIGKAELTELRKMCKANNVSIGSAMMTAAAKEFIDPKKMIVVVDARPEENKSMVNYFGGVIIESMYDVEKDFWENSKYIHNQLHMQLEDRMSTMIGRVLTTLLDCNLQNAICLNETGCYESKTAKAYNDIYSIKKSNVALAVSNLGVGKIESKFDNVGMKNVNFSSPLRPGADGILGVITVNGEMCISLGYNKDADIDYKKLIEGVEVQLGELVKVEKEDVFQLV